MHIPSETPLEKQQLQSIANPGGTFWHRVRFGAVCNLIVKFRIEHILDVGAGSGHLGMYLNSYLPQIQYRFLEPISSLNQALSQRFGVESCVQPNARFSPRESIVCLDVLEHIEHDSLFIAELFEKMEIGNYLIVTVPAMPILFSKWDEYLGHYRRYSKSSLLKKFASTQFKIVECGYIFPELVLPGVVRRLATKKGLKHSAEFPDLPNAVDYLLEKIGMLTIKIRKFLPFGSSILLVAVKPKPVIDQ